MKLTITKLALIVTALLVTACGEVRDLSDYKNDREEQTQRQKYKIEAEIFSHYGQIPGNLVAGDTITLVYEVSAIRNTQQIDGWTVYDNAISYDLNNSSEVMSTIGGSIETWISNSPGISILSTSGLNFFNYGTTVPILERLSVRYESGYEDSRIVENFPMAEMLPSDYRSSVITIEGTEAGSILYEISAAISSHQLITE